jgi:hypothetical protein
MMSIPVALAARMALLDSVLDSWATCEAPNTWHAEPASMSMDLPAEFGFARSADLLVLVADRFGAILSRSRDRRSCVAFTTVQPVSVHGVQGVPSSNPGVPTNFFFASLSSFLQHRSNDTPFLQR